MSLPSTCFISNSVHERKVKLGDDQEHTLHFRELTNTDFRKLVFAERSEDEDVRAAAEARMISMSLCDQDGKPALTLDDAVRLKPAISRALADAVLDVNGPPKGNALPPEVSNGSGTS